jgi:hypothetical protein
MLYVGGMSSTKKSPFALVGGALTTAVLLLSPGIEAAGTAHAVPPSVEEVTVPPGWRDLTGGQAVVPADVVDVLELEAANEESRDLGTAIAALVDSEPSYSYSYLDENWVVGFSGEAPPSVTQALEGTGTVFREGLGYDASDLEALLERVVTAVHATLPSSAAVGGGIDHERNVISVDVGLVDDRVSTAGADSSLGAVDLLGFTPELTTTRTPGSGIDFQGYGHAGGTRMSASDGATCTSGFVAKSTPSDAVGVLTASHCPKVMEHASGDPFWFSSASEREHFGAHGDVQFHRSPLMMDAWFHWSHGRGRPVLDVRNARQNEGVCKYGVITNHTCGNVANERYGLSAISPLTGRVTYLGGLTRVTALVSSGGDSGGPLYGGNTAMGTLVGIEKSTGARLFTKISHAQSATGTKVCLDPVCR